MINSNKTYPNFTTKYIIIDSSTVYALVITDRDAPVSFATNYPEYIPPPGVQAGPGFPDNLNDEWSNMFLGSGAPTNKETATAYILDEKNAGVALSKRNSGGSFSKLGATKIGDGSDAMYTETNCNNEIMK